MNQFPKALVLFSGILAGIFAPPAPVMPSAWMAENLIVPDGPRGGGRYDPDLSPYIAPIVDEFRPTSTTTFGAVRKSQQVALTTAGVGLCGAYIDQAPCKIGYALPTIDLLRVFNREKLAPAIAGTPALKRKVRPQSARDAEGSTVDSKRFAGGSLQLINGNSAVDLKNRTLKIGIADEVDSWPAEVDDEGDPLELFKGRFTAFHATGDWRLLVTSTPGGRPFKRDETEGQEVGGDDDGISRIDALFQAGDRRFWKVPCPHCSTEIVLEFKQLRFNRKPPFAARYETQCCGCEIAHHEKPALIRAGRFVATNADGVYPSWHVDALISLVTTWDKIAEAWWNAQGDEKKLKAFFNLWLGLPYEMRGDAPDHKRLLERKGGYRAGHIPPRGLLLAGGADVQHNGIWWSITAYAPNAESWQIAQGFIEGDTTKPDGGAFAELTKVYERRYPDAFGGFRDVDGFAIDAGDGGRFNQVLAWCRGRPKTYAIKGVPGWHAPALGMPTKVDIALDGAKIIGGGMLWPVGTWNLKSTHYSNLRKPGRGVDGAAVDPDGYCHFHDDCDENFFKQITSEYLGIRAKGRKREWIATGPNHLLDARIYTDAMADHLGLYRMTPEEWQIIARERGGAELQADLFAPRPLQIQAAAELAGAPGADQVAAEQHQVAPAQHQVAPGQAWVPVHSNWLGRR